VDADDEAMAGAIVAAIRRLARQKTPLNDMAVLVRLNAQTPYIEQELIAAGIPYRVSRPFYDRPEIRALIDYCRVAWIEQTLRSSGGLTSAQAEFFSAAWTTIYSTPKRYFSQGEREAVLQLVTSQQMRVTRALKKLARAAEQDWLAERLARLAEDIGWLVKGLKRPARRVLAELEQRLGYSDYLRHSSGLPQTGEGRAASVAAFIAYSAGKGSLLNFMQHIRALAGQRVGRQRGYDEQAVTISTIHKAKGLEWPIVFVPHCNQGAIPFFGEDGGNLEEERRLFHVAITRTRRELHLHSLANQPISQFLTEAGAGPALQGVAALGRVAALNPDRWQAADALELARRAPELGLERYFLRWWDAPASRQKKAGRALARLVAAARARGGLRLLGLVGRQSEWWQALAPARPVDEDADFDGLDELLAARRALAGPAAAEKESGQTEAPAPSSRRKAERL
jgi:DNA helicase-2/ATP-dependent DNA helicase PcrA